MSKARRGGKKVQRDEMDESVQDEGERDILELTKQEQDIAKQSFIFYQKNKGGNSDVERFELGMLLEACGQHVQEPLLSRLQDFLDERKADKIDSGTLVALLTKIRQLELDNEYQADGDEYLDAFVALGGSPTKEDYVLKSTLIEIIKMEFELTIDMEDYLRKIGGDNDEIDYNQFCVLLDAGTSGNPSRVSSYLSNNKGSSFMRFSYFEKNMEKLPFFL